MIVRNTAQTTKTIVSNGNSFPGTVEGQTYTATEDNQLLRLWGNIVIPVKDGGMCSAVIENVQGRVEPTSNDVTFSGGAAITKNRYTWGKGLLMGAGAKVLLTCRGLFSDDDWTVLQAVGVNCFDKDTAIY
jgi:hypothetical protein